MLSQASPPHRAIAAKLLFGAVQTRYPGRAGRHRSVRPGLPVRFGVVQQFDIRPDHVISGYGGTSPARRGAEVAITRLDTEAVALVETEALSRLLLRAEAIASSRIEGLVVGARRLLRAEAARQLEGESSDVTAAEVAGEYRCHSCGRQCGWPW
ncbi:MULTISPECIES: Fic/DOC family N-terminal domain-containing protein [Nocardia]|uniref:Fic/DOC family N-terminal domain-containing protein n=1 Tax=Nocardia TaxID=1817 RepID=UPI001915CDDD|nr:MULTISPECIES: Fic/DOC family N-terminal domain-containing protein [Nocardia]